MSEEEELREESRRVLAHLRRQRRIHRRFVLLGHILPEIRRGLSRLPLTTRDSYGDAIGALERRYRIPLSLPKDDVQLVAARMVGGADVFASEIVLLERLAGDLAEAGVSSGSGLRAAAALLRLDLALDA